MILTGFPFHRSKREVYNLLAVDVGYYLPIYEQVSIYFLKDIVANKKKCKYSHSFPALTLFILNYRHPRLRGPARPGAPVRGSLLEGHRSLPRRRPWACF